MDDFNLKDEIERNRNLTSNLVDGMDFDSSPVFKELIIKAMIDELIDEIIKIKK